MVCAMGAFGVRFYRNGFSCHVPVLFSLSLRPRWVLSYQGGRIMVRAGLSHKTAMDERSDYGRPLCGLPFAVSVFVLTISIFYLGSYRSL